MSRELKKRARSKRGGEDQLWVNTLLVLGAMMVAVVLWRWFNDSRPAEQRLGAVMVTGNKQGIIVEVPLSIAPQTPGSVVAVAADNFEMFLVCVGTNDYRVWQTRSRGGKPIRWDGQRGIFIDRSGKIGFDMRSGQPTTAGESDSLRGYINRATPVSVEITLQAT